MARIIFDLDGTLVHSAPTLAAAGNRLLDELGRAPLSVDAVAAHVGRGVPALVAGILAQSGGVPDGDLAPYLARFRAIYEADPLTGTAPYSDVAATLARLAAAGHGLGVCTQKLLAPARALLEALGLMPPITALTGGDSLDVLKPDPRMFRHAADQLLAGAPVMVGDSEIDAQTARTAGVPFLLFTRGYRHCALAQIPHAARFSDYAALPGLLDEVLPAGTLA